jgi:GT2 family glycosyltransferase
MKLKFVYCSKSKDEMETKTGQSLARLSKVVDGFSTQIFLDNSRGLSECYNEAIEETLNEEPIDAIVFLHDDIEINDMYLADKLQEGFENFDILGLAGCCGRWELKSPVVWNNSDPKAWSGAVAHHQKGLTWMTPFGAVPHACVLLDGLFLAVKGSELENLRFDPQFDFHHYDLDFCLTAKQAGLKLGTTPIWVTHQSIGDWRSDPNWRVNELKFIRKWST